LKINTHFIAGNYQRAKIGVTQTFHHFSGISIVIGEYNEKIGGLWALEWAWQKWCY